MGFGALGGFEYMAILAGETKAPARSVTRSVFIAAPVIALMFVLGTSSVVAYVPNDDIDLIGPVAQVLRLGYGPFGIATPLVTVGHPDDAGDAGRAGERRLHRRDPAADGGRVGSHAAGVVQPSARHLPDAGELDHAGRRVLVRHRVAEPDRRRARRGVPAAVQRQRHLLRAHLRGDVRPPARRAARRHAPAAAVAAAGVVLGTV